MAKTKLMITKTQIVGIEQLQTNWRACPQCGRATSELPALSRSDQRTRICAECGTTQALLGHRRGYW